MFSSTNFRSSTYFPQINLLRGIAALMVSCFHFIYFNSYKGPLFAETGWTHRIGNYGMQGVYVFFVISGFVIPLSMYKGNYKLQLFGKFILKRSLRIEPPYLISIVVILCVNFYLANLWAMPYHIDIKQFLLHIGYLIPFTFGKYEWYNILFWTLAIEFQYYLLVAFIYPLLTHKNKMLQYAVLLLFLCGPFISANISFLPLFMPCFLLGFLLFLNYIGKMDFGEMLLWIIGIGVMNYFYRDPAVIISTTLAFFFIWKIKSDTWIGNRLGDISYSYYLIHGIIGSNFLIFNYDPNASYASKIGLVAFTILLALIGSTIFWWLFERPSKKWSHKIKLN